MKLVKRDYRPFLFLEKLEDEFSKLFDISGNNYLSSKEGVFAPSLDLSEDADSIYLEADLPGFDQKNISAKIIDDSLDLSAKREEKTEEKNKNYFRCERFSGSFYREINLPVTVDEAKIKAKYEKGVLNITLPKKTEEVKKDIKIDIE
jgi:HSP20 family protein